MSELSANLASTLLGILATYMLHSTLLLAAVWALLRFARGTGHALVESAWKFAATAGLVTTPLVYALDLSTPVLTISSPAVVSTVAPVPVDPGFMAGDLPLLEKMTGVGPVPAAAARTEAHDPSPGIFWRISGLATFLATILAVGGLLRLVWQSCAFHRHLVQCSTIRSGPARDHLDELLVLAGSRWPVTLLSSSTYHEPIALGLLRRRIVLPSGSDGPRLSDDELRALLAHELAHLARGDAVWLLIGRFLCTCLACQPLNFLARREWQRAGEFGCDRWAVGKTGEALSLARCLTVVAEWRSSRRDRSGARVAGLAAGAAGALRSDVTRRVEALVADSGRDDFRAVRVDRPAARAGRRVLGVLALGMILALACRGPRISFLVAATTGDDRR